MNREEERMDAALKYANAVTGGVKDDVYFDIVMKTHLDATNWADEHPRKGLVDIEKVCNFLSNIDIKKYTSSLTDGVGFVNIHIGDIIEDMKKAMEE